MPLSWKTLFEQYVGLYEGMKLYWTNYGGIIGLVTSPYFLLAIALSYVARPIWLCPERELTWYDLTLAALPNLLGFTLGGYAILLAFGDDRFRKLISKKTEQNHPSYYMAVNGAFVHFIIVQIISILLAVCGNAWAVKSGFLAWAGCTLFIYSFCTALAAAMAVLDLADLFGTISSIDPTRKCPFCAEEVMVEAVVCKHCSRDLFRS